MNAAARRILLYVAAGFAAGVLAFASVAGAGVSYRVRVPPVSEWRFGRSDWSDGVPCSEETRHYGPLALVRTECGR